ncbi:transcriptional regulator with XRE-family HTH domain [Salirhabdus euzebyi]|uniref:Transcriptional regulator with XRE-family HTH domain n=1 Tax=Salirhabdus euzebyi TaxID=394506 RepID=A0A841PX47_9BACI|nr:helix-turn-helix transcriptional regulator [Salirhabdus euzebyi]MBB6451966.1 transcriptional regulator with XRE-family HTH domain [Salirhabdus euzebyi]
MTLKGLWQSNFKNYLDSNGIRQSWIVEKTGYNKSTISNLYKKGTIPTYQVGYNIAKILGVRMSKLWYLKEDIDEEMRP